MNRVVAIALTLLFAWPAVAQVRIHPETIVPGQRFAVLIEATRPSRCDLDGPLTSSLVNDRLEVEFAAPSENCAQVMTTFRRAYGPFRAESIGAGRIIEVRVTSPGGMVGSGFVTVASQAPETLDLIAGMYWDPQYPGIGVALSEENGVIFAAAYSYERLGQRVWHVAQGRLRGNGIDTELIDVVNGTCLTCGLVTRGPLSLGIADRVQIALVGPASAILTLGNTDLGAPPRRGLLLQPFGLAQVESESTAAGATFILPDLDGTWLFARADGSDSFVTDLAQRPTGFANSGMAWFESDDDTVRLECGILRPALYQCRLVVSGRVFGNAGGEEITYHTIRSDDLVGLRLD